MNPLEGCFGGLTNRVLQEEFNDEVYSDDVAEARANRPPGSDKDTCDDCGAPSMFYAVDLPAKKCLCGACVNAYYLTKYELLSQHLG